MAELEDTALLPDHLLLVHRELELLDHLDGHSLPCFPLHSPVHNRVVPCPDLLNEDVGVVDRVPESVIPTS